MGVNVVRSWSSYWSEQELMQAFGMTKAQVSRLRDKGLPFIRLDQRNRVYEEGDVTEFFATLRTVHVPAKRVKRSAGQGGGE